MMSILGNSPPMRQTRSPHRVWLLIPFLLLALLNCLPAQSVQFTLRATSEEIRWFRYRIGNTAPWAERSSADPVIHILEFSPSQDVLEIQQAREDRAWSPSYHYHYGDEQNRWTLSEEKSPASFASLHLLAELPQDAQKVFFEQTIGFDLQYGMQLPTGSLVSSAGYRWAQATTSWVTTFHELSLLVGLGYPLVLGKNLLLTPTLESGVLLHLVVGDLSGFQQDSVSLFFDPQLRLAISGSMLLSETLRFSVKPYLLWYFEEEAVLFSSGCSFGLEAVW